MAANIIITQGLVGAPAGQSNDQLVLATPVQLRNEDNSGVQVWRWTMVSRPLGSTAVITGAQSATAFFTPDLPGSYMVELALNGGAAGTQRRLAVVRSSVGGAALPVLALRVPAAGESTEANWPTNIGGWWGDFALIGRAAAAAYAQADTTAGAIGTLTSDVAALQGDVAAAQADIAALQAQSMNQPTSTVAVTVGPVAPAAWSVLAEMSLPVQAGQDVDFTTQLLLVPTAAASSVGAQFRYALDGVPLGPTWTVRYTHADVGALIATAQLLQPVHLPRERAPGAGTVTVEWQVEAGSSGTATAVGTDRRLRVWP